MKGPFHTVHGVLKATTLKWFAIPFSSGPLFVRTLHHDPFVLGGPTRHDSQFHWIRQGCGPCYWFNFLWLWFQCVCPLMPSRNTYRLTWVSLTLDVGYLFMAAPAKRSHCSLPWRRGIPHHRPFWPWTWNSSSRSSCAHAATAPWTWGCSSRPPPGPRAWGSSWRLLLRCHSLALLAAAPDLGCGVAPPLASPDLGRTRGSSSTPRLCAITAACATLMKLFKKWFYLIYLNK